MRKRRIDICHVSDTNCGGLVQTQNYIFIKELEELMGRTSPTLARLLFSVTKETTKKKKKSGENKVGPG